MMNIEEVLGRYVITHYGNLVLHKEPEFDESRQLWISQLHSDYPILINNDLTSERKMRFIKMKEVMAKTGIARSTVWYMVKNGTLPKPRKLSPRVTVWVESEIDEFIKNIIEIKKIN